jgi:heme A synthase
VRAIARFAAAVLAYDLLVILWGAYVRATGSGAGCGAHWPLCNGEIVPRAPRVETLIELTHRVSSGIALLLVVALVVAVFRRFPAGHAARWGAAWSLVFMLTEAGIGAGLVLFELVAENESTARALSLGTHLVNTFLLLAASTLTVYWCHGGRRPRRVLSHRLGRGLVLAHVALLLVGASGAISALGDTLYPAASLREALRQDLSPTTHVLIRLRVLHPLLAVTAGVLLLALPRWVEQRFGVPPDRRLAATLGLLVLAQLAAGTANVALLAPVWMQMVHLLLADLLWIALVLFSVHVLTGGKGG